MIQNYMRAQDKRHAEEAQDYSVAVERLCRKTYVISQVLALMMQMSQAEVEGVARAIFGAASTTWHRNRVKDGEPGQATEAEAAPEYQAAPGDRAAPDDEAAK